MNQVRTAVSVELRKAWASPVMRSATVLVVLGITVLVSAFVLAAQAENEQILAQLGPLAEAQGWELHLGLAAQVTGAGAVLGFGVALSWWVGREFADGTISALFALPVRRAQLCGGKLIGYGVWAVAAGGVLTVLLGAAGLLAGHGFPDHDAVTGLGRQFLLTVFSAGLALPAAWAATLGRGLLPGVAATIGIVIIAQVGVVAGAGAWLPLASPAFWAMEPAAVTTVQLALSLTVPVVFTGLALYAWRRLQLDR